MARPRTPTNVLDARGAFQKDPQRKRPHEPQVLTQFPAQAPARLSEEQRNAWDEIVKLTPAGVLTGSDVLSVEIAACLLAEFWRGPDKMTISRINRLHMLMGKMGLDPSGRASLVVHAPESNPFDDV